MYSILLLLNLKTRTKVKHILHSSAFIENFSSLLIGQIYISIPHLLQATVTVLLWSGKEIDTKL